MKASLSNTWNSPNQQWGWVGTGRVLSYDLFEFALIRVAAKSKRPPKAGCSFHKCIAKKVYGNVYKDHCFLETQRIENEKIKQKPHQTNTCKTLGSLAIPRKTLPSSPQARSGEMCTACHLCGAAWPFLFS